MLQNAAFHLLKKIVRLPLTLRYSKTIPANCVFLNENLLKYLIGIDPRVSAPQIISVIRYNHETGQAEKWFKAVPVKLDGAKWFIRLYGKRTINVIKYLGSLHAILIVRIVIEIDF